MRVATAARYVGQPSYRSMRLSSWLVAHGIALLPFSTLQDDGPQAGVTCHHSFSTSSEFPTGAAVALAHTTVPPYRVSLLERLAPLPINYRE